jgi:hypothetical protein
MIGRQLTLRERTEVINLEEFMPQDHLLRAIDRYLDLMAFRSHLQPSNPRRPRMRQRRRRPA